MSRRIVVSDEYRWSAAPELFNWVVEFLLNNVRDSATNAELKAALDYQRPAIDLRGLPDSGRWEVLQALREHLAATVETGLKPDVPELQRRSAIGHIKVLKLMADDVVRSGQ